MNISDYNEAYQVLSKVRERYTQKELASLLHYSPRHISRWESGQIEIPYALLPALRVIASKPSKMKPESKFTFIDLFAGIGGIRMGFEAQGGRCVYTSEWDSYAQKTYADNFPDDHNIAGDITKVHAADIPDHDVLLAGFPCQPFSLAGVSKKNAMGRPHGFECATQGTLFFDVARIIAEKKPKAFLLENVKNLLSHNKGHTFSVIKDTLQRELGYHITWRVIDGQHFVPQHRERILIVGFREKTGFDWDALQLPQLGTDTPKLKDILHPEDGTETDVDDGKYIDQTGKVHDKYILSDKLWNYLQAYAEKHRAKGNGFGCSVVKPENTSRTLSARYHKDGSEILIYRGEGKNPRRLTPRECARLMGYPDDFKINVSDTRAYKQFGNSVVMPLMEHVASLMQPWILELKEREENAVIQEQLSYD
ncbi:DNA (cytosine-5-)-methyltransferase [Oxalobacter formigenes]|uniref:DNA (cytosine-5-)-methyltransferase n=1 Tax=Oxalobacter formigenes TaxID=847 RepID=UPI0022AE64DD|nr:DNA (cytosine-5-)-methyltransferase [Oxalobacter formigenes]WAW05471.1 DNA (cytosine-5-)-methyltransferase [Oxalobacter formigenes]